MIKDLLEGRRWPTDLIVCIIWSTIALVAILTLKDGNLLRVILSIPLLLFIPGYGLVSSLWPEKTSSGAQSESGMGGLERIAISIGSSLAIVPVIGLVLNHIAELNLQTIVHSTFALIITLMGISWYRRVKTSADKQYHMCLMPGKSSLADGPEFTEKMISLTLVICIIISVCVSVYIVLIPIEGENFTEFYLLDQNRTIEGLPKELMVNETAQIIVGVSSHEYGITNYTVRISLLNATISQFNEPVYDYNLTLNHYEYDERNYSVRIDGVGDYKMVFELFRENEPDPYRELHIWLVIIPQD